MNLGEILKQWLNDKSYPAIYEGNGVVTVRIVIGELNHLLREIAEFSAGYLVDLRISVIHYWTDRVLVKVKVKELE